MSSSALIMSSSALPEDLSATDLRRLREVFDAAIDEVAPHNAQLDRVALVESLLGRELSHKLGIYRLPEPFKLSVVMPVYNEIRTLAQVIERVPATRLPLEIVIVDDGSRDGSREFLAELKSSREAKNSDLK